MLVYIVQEVQELHLITIVVDTRSLSNEDSTLSLPRPITTRYRRCHGVITEHIDILSQHRLIVVYEILLISSSGGLSHQSFLNI
jgi:hypothetical protein